MTVVDVMSHFSGRVGPDFHLQGEIVDGGVERRS